MRHFLGKRIDKITLVLYCMNMKKLTAGILFLTSYLYPQDLDKKVLTVIMVQNYCNNWIEIEHEFTKIQTDIEKARFHENYNSKIHEFEADLNLCYFSESYDVDYFINWYYQLLGMEVPDIIQKIYMKYDLGKNGHTIYMTIFLGSFILQTENKIKEYTSPYIWVKMIDY